MKKTKKQTKKTETTEARVGRKKMTGRRAANAKNPIQKIAKKAAIPQKLNAVKEKASRIEPNDVAKGAAAISIAAGMIAAGAALMDKENRRKVGKTAGKGMRMVSDMATEMADEAGGKYQAVAQSVPFQRSSKKQSRKGRSKKG